MENALIDFGHLVFTRAFKPQRKQCASCLQGYDNKPLKVFN